MQTLKKKFEDIFGAACWRSMIDNLLKEKKRLSKELKDEKIELQLLEQDLDYAYSIHTKIVEQRRQLEQFDVEFENLEESLNCATAEWRQVDSTLKNLEKEEMKKQKTLFRIQQLEDDCRKNSKFSRL